MDLGTDFISEFRARRIRTQITWVTKDGGMIRDSFPVINSPGAGFSGARTRLQWSTHQALAEHAPGFSGVGGGGVLEPPTLSKNSRARRKILGVICRKFRENLGILHHQTASFAGAPITTREEAGSLPCDSAACGD